MPRPILTAEQVLQFFAYDPETGFITKISDTKGNPLQQRVGYKKSKGYLSVRVLDQAHFSHRLAWLMATGSWPIGQIDHINGIPDDNRLANLRDVDKYGNAQNLRKARRDSKTGLIGVSPCRRSGKFIAVITIDGRQKFLGRFESPQDAHECYLQAKRAHHLTCTI